MNQTFRERYLEVAVDLLLQLPNNAGISDAEIFDLESRLGVQLPQSLHDYLSAVGKLKLNLAHNRLLAPDKWFVDDGHVVFMEENQRVVFWGVRVSDKPESDPPVFQGVNRYPKNITWHHEQDRLSEFLVLQLQFQAAMGGFDEVVSAEVEPSKLSHFESQWHLGGESNGLIAFRRRGQVACFLGSRTETSLQMFAGAISAESATQLKDFLGDFGIEFDEL